MTGLAADVAAEFRLHGIRATVAPMQLRRDVEPACAEGLVVVRNTPIGDFEAWVRADPAHFFDPAGYPGERVPVVDVDLWEAASPRPRLLLVVSAASRAMLVCSPRRTHTAWVRRGVDGPRGFVPAFTCPRGQLKTFAWLKQALL